MQAQDDGGQAGGSGEDRPREGGGNAHRPIPVRQALRDTQRTPPPPPASDPRAEQPKPEAAEAAGPERTFEVDGEPWVARLAGESAAGATGGPRAYIVAVRFYRAGSDEPVREALLPRGRFEMLYDEELREAFRAAVPLDRPPPPAE